MRPPLVPYNPVITLTWTFSFFWVLFSPSTPVILRRLLTSFSFLFLNSGGTSRLLIHTRIHRDARAEMIRKRRESTSARRRRLLSSYTPSCCVTISLERHPESLLPIPAALPLYYCCCKQRQHSTCSASIHPSISCWSAEKEKPDSPFRWIYFYSSGVFFLNAAHVISSVFIR